MELYDLDFLVDVLCKVSVRFRRLATDYSLWKGIEGTRTGHVVIAADGDPGKAEFVVQECLNSDTRGFLMYGTLDDFFPVLTSPRYAEYINPTARFPNLKLSEVNHTMERIKWTDSSSDDEKEA